MYKRHTPSVLSRFNYEASLPMAEGIGQLVPKKIKLLIILDKNRKIYF